MHMCVHATPEGEPSVTLIYLLICGVTSQPLPCSGAGEETHTRVAEPHISMSCFFRRSDQREVLQPVDNEALPPSPGSIPLSVSPLHCFNFFFNQKSSSCTLTPQRKEIMLLKTHQWTSPEHWVSCLVITTRTVGFILIHFCSDTSWKQAG